MPAEHPAHERRVDSDGVVRVEQRRASGAAWVLGIGIAVTCLCVALSLWLTFDTSTVELSAFVETEPPPVATPPPASEPPVVARPRSDVKSAIAKHLEKRMAEVPEEVRAQLPEGLYEMPKPGEGPTGMMLFPAPGTDPLKKGIIVPEDFELPPGYVRRYQTTDDGEQLPAILMFHPDHPPLDANGQPMTVPENGIVPPELAPPGMPIQMLNPEGTGEAEQGP